MSAPKLVIVGDSLFAEIAYECFTHDSDYEVVAFAAEHGFAAHEELFGLPVVGLETLPQTHPPAEHAVYVAIVYTQMNRLRTRLAKAAKTMGYPLASYVSSRAFVWANVRMGEHCFVLENNTLQPFVEIGNNVVLWSGSQISHHSRLHDNCFLASHVVVSGSCEIGQNTFLGANSTLGNDITIGSDSWIGPHVVLTRDVAQGSFYRPARSDLREESSFEILGVEPEG